MQSERHNATSHHFSIAEYRTILRANDHAIPDARRFAGIFRPDGIQTVAVNCGDTTLEEQNESDDRSGLEFGAAFDENTSPSRVASMASMDRSSILSVAQQIIAGYRAVHGGDHVPECGSTGANEKGLPQIPDDQRSMYTLAAPVNTQSSMDMTWRPKPKVHMHRADQRALMQAQSQAIAMMHDAGLKPANKIQCRRQGCANILSDVQALKYHLHIHNIADSASRRSDASPSAACKRSKCSASNSGPPKRNHSRSKSSLGTQHQCSTASTPPRKLSAGSLLPSLFSSRESTSEVLQAPTLMTIAKAFASDRSPSNPGSLSPVRNDETHFTRTSTSSRGRRKGKESTVVSMDAERCPSITMLLSRPSSPIGHGRLLLTPHTNLAVPVALGPVTDNESDSCVPIQNKIVHPEPEQLEGSRSPIRALSPTRAMSPIRAGIKRILSIGSADNIDK